MIYFTADNHFCHGNIIGSCCRPFKDVSEMNKEMIKRWNGYTTDRDEIYMLGDFLYKGTAREANNILSQLKGRKYLIRGNHDKYLDNPEFRQEAFEWIKDYYVLKYNGIEFVLFHYPILQWNKSRYGSIHLYGHVHNSGEAYPEFGEKLKVLGKNAVNVGVDVNNFYLVSVKQIINLVKKAKKEA